MSTLPALSPRLSMVAGLVREGSITADIGCDHGQLIATLAHSGQIPGGFACDLRPDPLRKAKTLLCRLGLSARVQTILCSGLCDPRLDDAQDIVVAGMGGETIAEIVLGVPWTKDPARRFILQPMSRPQRLREALFLAGFSLLRERAVLSEGRYYSVMLWQYTGETVVPTPFLSYTGALPEEKTPESRALLLALAQRLIQEGSALSRAADPEGTVRLSLGEAILQQCKL